MTVKTRRSAAILLPILALFLNGCWESASGSLIPRELRSQPIANGIYRYHSDGDVQEAMLTRLHGGGYAWESTVDEDVVIVLAHEIRPNWYILQMMAKREDSLLGIAHVESNRVQIFDPDCDTEIAAIDGVERSSSDCRFSTLDSFVSAANIIVNRLEKTESPELAGWLELGGR